MRSLCQLEEIGIGCFGCCGHSWTKEGEVNRDIKKNTIRYKEHEDDLVFLHKEASSIRPSGGCYNLVQLSSGKVGCSLHPCQHSGKDLRDNVCDKDYLCKTNHLFQSWSKEKQDKFIRFLNTKKLTPFEYSMGMDRGLLLKEFDSLGAGK
ncbi:MAG TPA: hypothetical protein VJG90_02920 [Candidatus Nanoarchaeia archaeon]|nr:hypothetical protein [Candidatus Nanoarchaeia archaeon]